MLDEIIFICAKLSQIYSGNIINSKMSQQIKSMREKVISIIQSKSQPAAVLELLQLQVTEPTDVKNFIRQTILLVFENQHDWQNLLKCLKKWKGVDKFVRAFYKRMKQRIDQPLEDSAISKISTRDMESQVPTMIFQHYTMYERRPPVITGIEKYFTNDNLKPQQKVQVKEESKKTQMKKEEPKNIQLKQQEPRKAQLKKEEVKIQQSKPKKMVETNESQKSNSISSRGSNFRAIDKKPTLGMLRRQQNTTSGQNLVGRRNTSRRTFGQGNQLKSIHVVRPQSRTMDQKIEQKVLPKQPVKVEQIKVQQQIPKPLSKVQARVIEPQIEIKPEQPRKLNIFERKQQAAMRTNVILRTQKKEQPEQQNQSKQKMIERSFSKSITPHKPLMQRKKIVLKKPSDFEENFFDSDDEFQSLKKFTSFKKEDQMQFYSEGKDKKQRLTHEEQQLRKQIEKECQSLPRINQSTNQNPQNLSSIASKGQVNPQIKKQPQVFQPKSVPSKLIAQSKQSTVHPSMICKPGHLFSDYEVSLMGFNPREIKSQVNYYQIVDSCKVWSLDMWADKWKDKTRLLKEKRQKEDKR